MALSDSYPEVVAPAPPYRAMTHSDLEVAEPKVHSSFPSRTQNTSTNHSQSSSSRPIITSNKKFKYIPITPSPLPPINPRACNPDPPPAVYSTHEDRQELVEDPFATPWSEVKNCDGTTGTSRYGRAGGAGCVFVGVVIVVLAVAVGVGVHVAFRNRG